MAQNEDIRTIVINAVNEAITMHNSGPMNTQTAAKYLCISPRKMQDLFSYIKHSRVGGKRLFLKADLDAYIKEQRS